MSARARKACEIYNAAYQTQHDTLGDIVQGIPFPTEAFLKIPRSNAAPDKLADRVRQFVIESEAIIPQAADALARNDLRKFGQLVDISHVNSRELLWNIIPETDYLQQSARKLGAIAASGFGAGFGGSVWALVTAADVDMFCERWNAAYHTAFTGVAHRGQMFDTFTSPSAFELAD